MMRSIVTNTELVLFNFVLKCYAFLSIVLRYFVFLLFFSFQMDYRQKTRSSMVYVLFTVSVCIIVISMTDNTVKLVI